MNNEWLYNGKKFEEDITNWFGFVYLITNTKNDRKYIGKKLFSKAATKQVKGKKKKIRKDSDWKDYYGSSKELLADVELLGKENFKREILYLCESRGTCNYIETREIMDRRALESEEYYNGQVHVRVHTSQIKKFIK